MGVTVKTIGELLDQLITADIKTFLAQEDIMNEELSDEQRLAAAIKAQTSNARRTALIRAIDERLGDGSSTLLEKTYG